MDNYFVITDPCISTCDTACVKVCPVDCIAGPVLVEDIELVARADRPTRFAGLQLFIDPESCIGCGCCASECPVEAIYEVGDVPARWSDSIARNADFYRR